MAEAQYEWQWNTEAERDITKAFMKFHAANRHIYVLFTRFAMQAVHSGRPHYSAASVFERMRWHMQIDTVSDDDLKLNNNYRAFYGRMFMHQYPQYEGFFRTRKSVSDNLSYWYRP